MPWGLVFVVAFVAFGMGRVVSRLLAKGQSRARKALGWMLMFGSSAASAVYALDAGESGGLSALLDRWRAAADAGPPPAAPTRKLYEGPWRAISTSQDGLCTIDPTDSHVYCWGDPGRGWPPSSKAVAIQVAAESVAVGKSFACARTHDGSVWCWRPQDAPTKLDLKGIVQLSVGDSHGCAIDRDGLTYCWGSNDYGERGGTSERPEAPVRIAEATAARSVAAGRHTSCVVLTNNEVLCWGATPNAGPPARITASPELIAGVPLAMSVALGESTACVVDSGGQLHCWGGGIVWARSTCAA